MRILWIEDNYSEQKEHGWFADLSQSCDIKLISDFTTAYDEIADALERYDLIILDIDLENSAPSETIVRLRQAFRLEHDSDFLREAGFHLFLQLLESGFPKERIVFFTGNVSETPLQRALENLRHAMEANDANHADTVLKKQIIPLLASNDQKIVIELIQQRERDALFAHLESLADSGDERNTYNQFQKRFREARIKTPHAIKKGENEQADLRHWATPHLQNRYLQLRRGIINGCQYLQERLNDHKPNVRFNDFLGKDAAQLNISNLQDYLQVLQQFLPLQQPASLSSLYKLFIRTLAHEWDACDPWKLERKNFDQEILAFARIMKMTRNWMAHSQIFAQASEIHVAYLFLLNMRAMFVLPDALLDYERILLRLFTDPLPDQRFADKVGKTNKDRTLPLVTGYLTLTTQIKGFNIDKAAQFHDLLNNAQKSGDFVERHTDHLLTGLLQLFWYFTSYQFISEPQERSNSVYVYYNFSYFDYTAKPWLNEFGRHFYPASFPSSYD